ncbi:hypothetical protein [Nostoc sp. FACHB-892]|nr:hypothetical protein [Nostoc sp. FACHB-892]
MSQPEWLPKQHEHTVPPSMRINLRPATLADLDLLQLFRIAKI